MKYKFLDIKIEPILTRKLKKLPIQKNKWFSIFIKNFTVRVTTEKETIEKLIPLELFNYCKIRLVNIEKFLQEYCNFKKHWLGLLSSISYDPELLKVIEYTVRQFNNFESTLKPEYKLLLEAYE